ncbi:MAG TPA: filamentous hemagglutinin N-terminal domain-containing protein, partial [Solimonas sp.]
MGKPSFKLRPLSSPALRRFYGLAAGALAPGLALAAPSGGAVVGGQASIGSPGAGNTVVNQTSQNAIINWQQFSVGGNEFVLFNQPSASAAVLNRVVGGLPSEILGNISANGRVFIVNPQGVMFGAGSRVDVGGLVTSTLNIRDQDFMSGRHVFAQGESAPGSIRNEGRISAGPGGFVVLAADRVENAGLISAPNGEVLLAAASKMTLTLDAEGLVGYSIDAAALSDRAGIENIGEIVASGGTVVLDAKVARSLMGNVINQRGRISARSVEERDGVIYLSAEGGDIENSGTLDASGTGNADGGRVVVHSDQDVRLTETGVVRADGAGTGNGGMIRLVAEQQLETAEGSVVSATAGPAGQLGGFVELSGHGGLKIRGQVDVGRRGQVLIDPLLLTIADGSGGSVGSTSSGTSATVYEQTIEGLLQSGADVALIADNRITLATLSDGTLDGRNANGTGGGLLLGIGTISEPTTNGVFVDGPPAVGYTFNPGPGGSSYGGIFFQTLGNAIRVDGRLRVSAGYSLGNIRVGDLEGNDIDVSGAGDIELGDVTLSGTGGSVVISNTGGSGSSQDIVIGSLAAAGASLVDIDARNNVQILGNLQADAALVEISSGFDGSGQISASGISGDQVRLQSSGGDISIGGVISANGGLRSGGDIDVDAAGGSVTLNGVSLDGRGQADISASNNARLLGSYDLGADDGELRVYADSVILGAALPAVGIGVTGGLDITADEVTAYGAAGDDAINATGDVSITAGTVEFTGKLTAGGEVNIDVDADVLSLQDVRGSRVRLAAAGFDITVGTISAAGGGSAGLLDVEVSGTETSRVQVGGIDLDTDGYALVSGASGIDGLDSASFTVGGDGTLELRTLSSLDLGSVFGVDGSLVGSGASVTGNVVDVGGDLTLTATGSVDLNAAVTAGGLATIMAGDSSSLSLASLEADGIVLYGGNNTSVSAGTLTANGGFRSSGDINVDAYGSYGGVAIGSIQLNGPGRVDVTGAAGVALRNGADVGAGGSLNLRADGGVLQFGSSASSPISIVGNLYGTANNGARIEAYQDIAVSSGDATLNANGSGASISLFGVLGAEDGRIEIDATGPISIAGLAAGSSIQVDATGSSGSISLGAIGLAALGDVRVAGANGVTLLGDIDAGVGGSIYVSASGGALTVGSDGAPAGSTMAFTGNLELETTNGADVRAWQDIEVTGGDLVIDADADLSVASLTASNGGVRLTAGGDISTGSITADGGFTYSDGVRVEAEGADPLMNLGSITLLNEGAVYLSGASGVAITQTIDAGGPNGTIEVRASGGMLSLGTASDAVDLVGNLAAYADSGAAIRANIGAAQDVELQVRTDGVSIGGLEAVSIIADGKITLGNTYGGTTVRGDIVIGTLDAGGNVSVASSRDVDASGTITAVGLVDIDAGVGAGGTGVAALGDVSGNRVYIEADGGVSTGLLTAVGISSGSGDFNVYVASAETVSVSGITLTGSNTGRAYLQGDNGITLDGTNFSLGSDGTLKLSAASSGLDFGTNFSLMGNLEANAGEIDGGAMSVTGDLTLKSPGDINLTGFVDAGGRLEIDGQGGAGVINLQGAYGDRVYIVNDGDITIGGTLSANGGGSASSHDLDLLANGGTLSVGGVAVADPGYAYLEGEDINLTPGGVFAVGYGGLLKIIANDQISFGTGSLESVSITGRLYASAQDIVGNRILTSGSMTLEVGNQLQVNDASGLLRADTGDLVINGDSDGALVTIGAASADRILITNHGSISTGNLTANGGGSAGNRDIHLQALDDGTGMGVATISVGTIALAATPAEGYVELYAQDGVVLSGGADVGASGALKVTSERGVVDLGDIDQGGSLEVVNYQGDILGGDLTADTVYLYNAGGTATANVELNTINATGNVDIQARDDITVSGDIVSTGGIVDLEAGGQVDLQNVGGDRVIVFTAGNIVTGSLSAFGGGTSAGNADVKIESTAGSVDVAGVDLAGVGYAYLAGDAGIDLVGASFDIAGGSLQLQTSGEIDFGSGLSDSFELDGNLDALAGSIVGTSVATLGGGYIDLEASGTVDVGALTSSGDLRVSGADGIVLGQDASAAGSLELRTTNQHASIAYTNLSAAGDVTVAADRGNVRAVAGDGNVSAGGFISISAQRNGSDDPMLAGNIEVGDLQAGATLAASGVTLDASGGVKFGLLETGTAGLADIDGDSLTANGITAANIDIDLVAVTGLGDGSASVAGDIEATSGALHVEAAGQIDVDGAITAATDITLSAGTGVTVGGLVSGTNAGFAIVDVYSNDGDIALNGGASAVNGALRIGDIAGGAVDNITTGALSAQGVSVLAMSTGAGITVNGNIGTDGDIQILAGGALDLNGSTTSANGFVFLRGQTVDTLVLSAGTYVDAQAADGLAVVGSIVASSGVDLGGDGVSVGGLINGGGGDVDIGTLGSGAIQLASVSGGNLHIG